MARRIRCYGESDVMSLHRLLNEVGQAELAAIHREPLTLQQCRTLLHRQARCLVATEAERVVGVLLLRGGEEGRLVALATLEVAVDARHRRQGIGTALLEGALALLPQDGFTALLLPAVPARTAAHAFFTANGFAEIGHLPTGSDAESILYRAAPMPTKKKNKSTR